MHILEFCKIKQNSRKCISLVFHTIYHDALLYTGHVPMENVSLMLFPDKVGARIQVNLLKPTGHVMHQPFNIQQLYALPTLYLCVLYLSENKQRLVPLTV